jgi:hypothetical protein
MLGADCPGSDAALSSADTAFVSHHAAKYWAHVARPRAPANNAQLVASLLHAPGLPVLVGARAPGDNGSDFRGQAPVQVTAAESLGVLQRFETRRCSLIEQLLRLQLESLVASQLGPLCQPPTRALATDSQRHVLLLHRLVRSLLTHGPPSSFVPRGLRRYERVPPASAAVEESHYNVAEEVQQPHEIQDNAHGRR